MTAKLSPNAGGLAVSVPVMAHGIDAFDDINIQVFGTVDAEFPIAYEDWGNRVQAFHTQWPAALQRAPDMSSALAASSPDLIDVQGLWTWSSKVSHDYWRRHRKPYVVTPRGMLDPWARANSRCKKRLFSSFVERAHLRDAFCLRATADMEAEHFRAFGLRAPIAIIPNAIPVPRLIERPVGKQRRLLFLSRIHPKKGIDFLLRAWRTLEMDFPDWELIIAGIDEGGHEAEMKSYAGSLGLARVRFYGAAFGDEKDRLYRSADAFVLPTHAENFGLVVAEALAQEVPVITTKNAPWSGLLNYQCGWWIDLNEAELTNTLRQAMSVSSRELQSMGARGRDWVMKAFGTERVAASTRELYLWVAGRGPKPEFVYDETTYAS